MLWVPTVEHPPSVADELKSLRIERSAPPRALPRWVVPAAVAAGVAFVAVLGWAVLAPRLFTPEVETTAVALVSPSQAQQLLVATGYVVPQRKANVAPRIGGRVARILIEDGSEVKAGEIIAVLEDADYRAQLAQAGADLRSSLARVDQRAVELTDAQRSWNREQIVQSKGVSTPQAQDVATARLEGAKAALASAKADAASARARVDVAKVSLENCFVRAPFAGRITQKLTDVGEIVFGAVGAGAGGNGGIASLADFGTLMVEADVSESQVGKVQPGTPAEIALDAFADKRWRGKVHEVRPRVDRAKATVTVKVAFADPTAGVLPDMGAKVTFLAQEMSAAAASAAPTPAVQADALAARGEGKVLWAVRPDGVISAEPVVTGPAVGNLISLRTGPPPGTKVVRRPAADLRPGMRVQEKQ
ncbi:MAG: efflux RND transporter periplasmic adaptor subunit [Myxococcales bacterium]